MLNLNETKVTHETEGTINNQNKLSPLMNK